ncbi:MAG: hypothetical protein U0133_06160 [Gemmatimonadales bacterium]
MSDQLGRNPKRAAGYLWQWRMAVGIPMLWGVWTTIKKASLLFR